MRLRHLSGVLAVAFVGVSCSSGSTAADDPSSEPSETTTTVQPAETTTPGPSSTAVAPSTSGAVVGGSGDAEVSDRWTVAGGDSPLALAVGDPEPEYPEGANGTVEGLADGRYALLIRQVDTTDHHLLVDVVELFLDDDAVREALADGDIDDADDLHGNYYVRNASPKMRDAALSPAASVEGTSATGSAAVVDLLVGRLSAAPGIPYLVRVESGRIVSVAVPAVVDPTRPE